METVILGENSSFTLCGHMGKVKQQLCSISLHDIASAYKLYVVDLNRRLMLNPCITTKHFNWMWNDIGKSSESQLWQS